MSASSPPCAFVIFGTTGDLTERKLIPALFALHCAGVLHPDTRIVGVGRRDWHVDDVRKDALKALEDYSKIEASEQERERFVERFTYGQCSYEPAGFKKLAGFLDKLGLDNRIFYTATPPSTYETIITGLASANLNKAKGDVRLVIEKPFGSDLKSAQELNEIALEYFSEAQLYRIDHYLAKETAQNVAALRFANTLFEPIWNNKYIDHVQITMAEEVGIEGRGSFYEGAGIIRDVIQNHLLQLVALVATEPPARYDAQHVRSEKVKVFQAMDCVHPEDVVIGQYTAGNGIKGYRQEDDVAPDSRTGTYAAIEFSIQNWRWAGVPFFVRSGKGLESKATAIMLHFKKPPHIPFALEHPLKADRLVLRLVPDEGISIRFNAKEPGQGIKMSRVSLNFYYDEEFDRPNPDAYETLLQDAMEGDATLFMRADEVEAQWRIVEPILDYWENSERQPALYQAGSWGPQEAYDFLERRGREWHRPRSDEENHNK